MSLNEPLLVLEAQQSSLPVVEGCGHLARRLALLFSSVTFPAVAMVLQQGDYSREGLVSNFLVNYLGFVVSVAVSVATALWVEDTPHVVVGIVCMYMVWGWLVETAVWSVTPLGFLTVLGGLCCTFVTNWVVGSRDYTKLKFLGTPLFLVFLIQIVSHLLEAALDERRDALIALSQAVAEKDTAKGQLENALFAKADVATKLRDELNAKAIVQGNLQTALNEKADVEDKLKSALDDKADVEENLKTALDEKAALEDKLKKALEELGKGKAVQEKADAKTDKETAETKLKEAVKEKKDAETKLQQAVKEKKDVETKLQEALKEKKHVETDLEEALKEKNRVETELEALKEKTGS